MKSVTQVLVFLMLTVGAAGQVHAAGEAATSSGSEVMRSGTKASSGQFGFGALVGMSESATAFDLNFGYSYHFSGDASGFGLGADLDIVAAGIHGAIIVPAARAFYDHELMSGLYLSPSVGLGIALGTKGGVGFSTRLGVTAKVVLNDLFLVTVQPVGVDVSVGTGGVVVSYNLLFGGGIIF